MSVLTVGTSEWYRENPARCLHSSLHNLKDSQKYSSKNEEVPIYGVYLRHRLVTKNGVRVSDLVALGKTKVGKGFFLGGKLTRSAKSNDDAVLGNLAFVPCVDEVASYALEDMCQRYLENQGRWIKPTANDDGDTGGSEWFDGWKQDESLAVKEFNEICNQITSRTTSGKINFDPRYYQKEAATSILGWYLSEDSDFYLMLKPRAGKNATSLLALCQLYQRNPGEKITALMISMWPSAFSGMKSDCDQYVFDGVQVECVNTQIAGWQSRLKSAQASDAGVILVMSSMQSLDIKENSGEFDSTKSQELKALGATIALFDESDHGLRTKNSLTICEEFGFTRRIWMSGSDLYAMRYLVNHLNHYSYNIYQEILDVQSEKIEQRPLIHRAVMSPRELPFGDDYDPDAMNQLELSRRVRTILKTNTDVRRAPLSKEERDRPEPYHLDPASGLWMDSQNSLVKFEKPREVEVWFDLTWNWENNLGWPAPCDHEHVFWSMPSVSSLYAMCNFLMMRNQSSNRALQVTHIPLVANSYNSATVIEAEVNRDVVRHGRTIFLTVGKMLRGAKAPWSAVVRWDDYSDVKIGLQMELRGQNTREPKFYVYECNFWRVASSNYELIRNSGNGESIDSLGQKLHNLIPMMVKGKFECQFLTWEESVKIWQMENVTEGFNSVSLLNEAGLLKHKSLLEEVVVAGEEKSVRDARAGKDKTKIVDESAEREPKDGDKIEPVEADPLQSLRDRGLTISRGLPLLVFLTDGEFREVATLFEGADQESFLSWCEYLCLDAGEDLRKSIPEILDWEATNHQLQFTARRFANGDFTPKDIAEFARSKDGDVGVPEELVCEMLDLIPDSVWGP